MKKLGIFATIFGASLLGVLAAFQIERITHRGPSETLADKMPWETPATFAQLPEGPADFRAAAKKIMPSVVSVDQLVATRDFFTDQVQVERAGTGSGVIISQDGYIVTNNHVVSGADEVKVRTVNDKSYPAKVIGLDPRADLAVIKIDAPNLQPAELGDSDRLDVGQWVLAVGNPLGYSNTVSAGVVSSLKRTLPAEAGTLLVDAIQTDAAINPGNSGGALTNAQGQVVGINSAIASTNGGSVGVGFAIPINRVKRVAHDLLQYGHVRYGDPGFSIWQGLIQDVSPERYQQLVGVPPPNSGLVIQKVDSSGPAAQAGIKPLDVLQAINGIPMNNPIAFYKFFADKRPGDHVSMKIWSTGNVKTVDLNLVESASF